MNEVKEALRNIKQNYKLFLQQQFTFIGALQHSRENAHDMIRPVASISQVQVFSTKFSADENREQRSAVTHLGLVPG